MRYCWEAASPSDSHPVHSSAVQPMPPPPPRASTREALGGTASSVRLEAVMLCEDDGRDAWNPLIGMPEIASESQPVVACQNSYAESYSAPFERMPSIAEDDAEAEEDIDDYDLLARNEAGSA